MIRLAALLLLTACAYPVPAHGQWRQAHCGDRKVVVERIISVYGEKLRVVVLSELGVVFETYASERNDRWTMIATQPDGVSCIVAWGEGFVVIGQIGEPT